MGKQLAFIKSVALLFAIIVVPNKAPAATLDAVMERLEALEKVNASQRDRIRNLESNIRRLESKLPPPAPTPSFDAPRAPGPRSNSMAMVPQVRAISRPPPDASSWTGFYAGAHGGGGWARETFEHIYSPLGALATHPLETGLSGFSDMRDKGGMFGGQFGYNWQLNAGAVVGLEADFSATTIKKSETHSLSETSNQCAPLPCSDFITTRYAETVENKVRNLGSVRARVGLVPMSNILVYGTGGLAWGNIERAAGSSISVGPCNGAQCGGFTPYQITSSFSQTTKQFGWVAGMGVDWKMWNNFTLGVLYLHYDLGNTGFPTSIVSDSRPGGFSTDIATLFPAGYVTADTVTVRMSWLLAPAQEIK